jgi:hypothetical protein
MLKYCGILVMLALVGMVGIGQEDGSAPYPFPEKIDEPSPQIVWRGCCSETWQNSPWEVTYTGIHSFITWKCVKCQISNEGIKFCYPSNGLFYVVVEEAEFCCYKGWKVFGICVSIDDTPTCWKRTRTTRTFLGCE